MQVENGKFVPYNGGKPVTGKTVGDPAIIKKYTESGGTGVATTAAPAT